MWYGGDILTMAGPKPQYVQAIAAKDGRIVYAGSKDGALKAAGPGARLRDLKGRTLLPGFIDTHAHVRASRSAGTHACTMYITGAAQAGLRCLLMPRAPCAPSRCR